THEAFTRAFSAAFGVSPSRFRAMKCGLPPRSAASGVHVVPGGETIEFHPPRMGDPPMDVRVETFPARRVAFMRHVGPYRRAGDTGAKLRAWAAPGGLVGPETLAIGVAHDDPDVTPADKVRYDACLTVGDSFVPEGEVGAQEVGGGEYAITTHRG